VYRETSFALGVYVFLQFVALLILSAVSLGKAAILGPTVFVAIAMYVACGLVILGAVLEDRTWARSAEAARLIATTLLLVVFGSRLFALLVGHS
jgi:hypothetical protein